MKIVFATNNSHKLQEVRQMLGDAFEVLSLKDIGCDVDIPETSDTLEGNALLKAGYVKEHYGYDCFADDTGLEVASLGGEPGVYSARYAGDGHDSEANMQKLLTRMSLLDDRQAQFRTVIALKMGSETNLFEGIVTGSITREKHGEEGFGYDPIFRPDGYNKCFAEMTGEEKNAISHRGRAVAKLVDYLRSL